jgi:hypothetical protein
MNINTPKVQMRMLNMGNNETATLLPFSIVTTAILGMKRELVI